MGPGQEGMRAVALPDEDGPTVDVFALTVEVLPDLSLAWDYFGPNSHVIFGEDIKPHQPPTDLLLAHTHAEDQPAVRALLHAFRGGTPVEIQFRIVGRDSTLRWVAWRCVPRRDDGRLLVDAVATDVSARHKLGELRRELLHNQVRYVETIDAMRDHATLARDANDNVLQRLFAAGLRLRMLHKRLHDVDAHAAAAIAFQLDEAANDLRAGIHGLNHLLEELASTEGLTPAEAS